MIVEVPLSVTDKEQHLVDYICDHYSGAVRHFLLQSVNWDYGDSDRQWHGTLCGWHVYGIDDDDVSYATSIWDTVEVSSWKGEILERDIGISPIGSLYYFSKVERANFKGNIWVREKYF